MNRSKHSHQTRYSVNFWILSELIRYFHVSNEFRSNKQAHSTQHLMPPHKKIIIQSFQPESASIELISTLNRNGIRNHSISGQIEQSFTRMKHIEILNDE